MSVRTLIVAVAALTASGAATLPASAAPEPGKMPLRATVLFNLVDRNGDGSIDKDELDVVRNAIFAALDANADGKLSKDELQAATQRMRDGARARFMQRPHFGWQGPPRDGRDGRGPGPRWDGRPGPQQPGPRQGMLDEQGPPQPQVGQTDAPDQGPAAGQQFATADQNGDGTITRDEFAAGLLPPVLGELSGR
jgi:hypothetical protein